MKSQSRPEQLIIDGWPPLEPAAKEWLQMVAKPSGPDRGDITIDSSKAQR